MRCAGCDWRGDGPCARHSGRPADRSALASERHCSRASARSIDVRRAGPLLGRTARDLPTAPGENMRGGRRSVASSGIVIAMYFDDHGPPHFHARHPEGSAKVRIDTREVIESSLGRRQLRLVLAWAELHQDVLVENWRRARAGETSAAPARLKHFSRWSHCDDWLDVRHNRSPCRPPRRACRHVCRRTVKARSMS